MSHDAQKKLLEEHRDINTHHDWWEFEYEWFIDEMETKGIKAENLCFSGFWSQGDGASFEGRVENWPKFFAAHNLQEQYPATSHLLATTDMYLHFTVTRGRYGGCSVHANTMQGDLEFSFECRTNDDPLARLAYAEITASAMQELASDAEKQFIELFRGHANQLYYALEQEYDYQTSEEAILDNLFSNELLEDAINDLEKEDDPDQD